MKIAARKITPPEAYAGLPGSEQKARVNSAAKPPEYARKSTKKYDLQGTSRYNRKSDDLAVANSRK
ncbi:MAG: hypothetical protein ACREDU_04125, partial [Methylocella sp.]